MGKYFVLLMFLCVSCNNLPYQQDTITVITFIGIGESHYNIPQYIEISTSEHRPLDDVDFLIKVNGKEVESITRYTQSKAIYSCVLPDTVIHINDTVEIYGINQVVGYFTIKIDTFPVLYELSRKSIFSKAQEYHERM